MNKAIDRLKLIFLGVFAAVNVGILIWTVGWVWPEQRCGQAHKWWDPYSRVCAQPVLTSDFTGRMITDSKSREEALRAIGRKPPPAATATPAKP